MIIELLNSKMIGRLGCELSKAGLNAAAVERYVRELQNRLDEEVVVDGDDCLVPAPLYLRKVPGSCYICILDNRIYHFNASLSRSGESIGWAVRFFKDVNGDGVDEVGAEKLKLMLDFLQLGQGSAQLKSEFIDSMRAGEWQA